MMGRTLVALLLVGLSASAHPIDPPKVSADLILVNAKIWTVDRERPEVEAAASWNGRILALGTTTEIRTLAGPKTVVIDARGRRVVPGFHDSHLHLLGSGLRLTEVALKDAADEAEFGRRLSAFDQQMPPGRWMVGGEWDHDRAFAGRLPTSADIDKYVANRPVLLRRYDGHMALANTKAIQMADITAATKDPVGGVIYRDPKTKQPTGLLRDTAMGLVDRLVPPPTEDEIVSAVLAALAEIRQNGITSATDMDGSSGPTRQLLFRNYQRMARSGQLTSRVELRWPLAEWEQLARIAVETDFGTDYLRIGGVKGFMDGSLGSSTAKMFEPYVNEPDSTGVFVTPREQMRELVEQADRARLSVCVHAIGDQGNATMLDIFGDVSKTNGPRDRRFRIEHAQHLRASDISRFGELGVVASMQPYHVADDGRWAVGRIGPTRCATSYAFRSLIDSGAKVAFGSDWSVAPLSPVLGIDAAVNRRTLDGKHPGGWFPEQRISVAEAIEAYTLGSAFASHQEREKGSVSPNKYADFTVLSRDILAPVERASIGTIEVLMTITGGKVVYDARPASEKR
jgi:predicted amidohydrolase YtcJ